MASTAVTAPGFTVTDLPAASATLIGLARVSTDAQEAELQHDALTEAACGRIYTEKVSPRKAAAERPGLAAALDYLRPGDTLVVWKLDRLGRSVKEVLTIADDLRTRGIGVRVLTGKLSGSYSPHGEGKFFFTMMAAFAEFERDIIHERTMAGLAAARAQGKVGGHPTVMDPDKLAAARARQARGESPTQIAKALGVSRASVYRHLGGDAQDAQTGAALARADGGGRQVRLGQGEMLCVTLSEPSPLPLPAACEAEDFEAAEIHVGHAMDGCIACTSLPGSHHPGQAEGPGMRRL